MIKEDTFGKLLIFGFNPSTEFPIHIIPTGDMYWIGMIYMEFSHHLRKILADAESYI